MRIGTRKKESITRRLCFLCREPIEEKAGLNVAWQYIIHGTGSCREFFDREQKDRARSRKGRYRTDRALLDLWLSGASGASGAIPQIHTRAVCTC